jgi:hypothetical protein
MITLTRIGLDQILPAYEPRAIILFPEKELEWIIQVFLAKQWNPLP